MVIYSLLLFLFLFVFFCWDSGFARRPAIVLLVAAGPPPPRRRSRFVRPLQWQFELGIFLGFGFWDLICTCAHHALASRACTCTCTCAAAVLPAALACRAEPLRCASAFASAALVASCVSRNS